MRSWLAVVAVALALGAAQPAAADRMPIAARVVWYAIASDGLLLQVSRGSDQGIDVHMHAHAVDAHDKPVPHGELTIIRVQRTSTTLKSKLTIDRVSPGDLRVVFD